MQQKIIGATDTTQTRGQFLLFEVKRYDEESRRKLSSSSKIVLRKEGPDSTVKKLHDNDIADQARNGLKGY